MIKEHLNINNLHHAYLIEGERDIILKEIIQFFEEAGINTVGNLDFHKIEIDNLKISDALNLRDMATKRSFEGGRKFFIFSLNSFTNEAQAVLLKMTEEPISFTHFFVIMPHISSLLPTLISRFYYIQGKTYFDKNEKNEVENFLKMSKEKRIDFIKEIVKEKEDTDDSPKTKANRFLDILEDTLYYKSNKKDIKYFEQIFNVREYIRQNGSSVKNMLESLALIIPVIQ
ncbi:MAG: hypothetical protein WC898_00065 [Candidatus Paceibacterota bacterium]|jgi:hypothetical protein